jgi:peptidoglycan/LPS O-acetylase OafA/YrhL
VRELAFYAVLLPLCVLTYRYIEAPGQKWGWKLGTQGTSDRHVRGALTVSRRSCRR